MTPKSFSEFGDLVVTVSPNFVRNIECMTNTGHLVSILSPKPFEQTESEVECYVVQQNNKFVKSITYPNNMVVKNSERPKVPEKNSNKVHQSQTKFEKRPQPIKIDQGSDKLKHSESKDSLVTQSLLNLTSYDTQDPQDQVKIVKHIGRLYDDS